MSFKLMPKKLADIVWGKAKNSGNKAYQKRETKCLSLLFN